MGDDKMISSSGQADAVGEIGEGKFYLHLGRVLSAAMEHRVRTVLLRHE